MYGIMVLYEVPLLYYHKTAQKVVNRNVKSVLITEMIPQNVFVN